MGPAFAEVKRVEAISDVELLISFSRPSPPFVLEALEMPIQKPGSPEIGTGPYVGAGSTHENEIRSNPNYYLGAPTINHIVVNSYPSVRSAWADLLRDRIDVLYEVGADALDSLTSAKNVAVFTHTRTTQHVLAFNTKSGALRSLEVRRALLKAIDFEAFIQDAFEGRAKRSTGAVWPDHWALSKQSPIPRFEPEAAAAVFERFEGGNRLRFTCLVRSDLERVGLVMKRQLEAFGIEMVIKEASLADIFKAIESGDFDAAILELIGGPSVFRLYEMWHSQGGWNPGGLGSAGVDAAFDKVRFSTNESEYRAAVEVLQQSVIDDPPGVFLGWGERTRAVSRRFEVAAEPGRDILTTLRLWRPSNAQQVVGRN
jgi:peptide/nickel transport system substrate-binding protein